LVNIAGVTWLRLTSFFPDPHVASFFFGITGLLALSLFFETKRRWFLVTAGILLLADILTFSRGGYLGLIAALAVLLWFERQSVRYFVQWGLGLTLLLLSSLVLGPVWERLISSFSLGDASSTERLVLWQTAWETWMMHPFFGVGLGQYVEWLYPGQGGTLPYYAHNLFLDIGVELGILSLMTFLILLFGAWASVWPLVKQKQPLALGIAAGLMLYGVHSLFETALFSVHILLLLTLLIGLAFALGAQPRSRVA
jgi:O-antigen ligase